MDIREGNCFNAMRRGTIITVLFAVIAAAILGVSYLLVSRPPLTLTVAVSPLAEDWMRQTVSEFNEAGVLANGRRRVAVDVVTVSDTSVIQGSAPWTSEAHPALWLATSSAAVRYADPRYDFQPQVDTVARTPLVWGGFTERVAVLPSLDWDAVATAAELESWAQIGGEANWQFLKLAFPAPDASMSGIAVLLSGAAHYHDTPTPTASNLSNSDFRAWLRPIVRSVPNYNSLGSNPAQAMAQRGTSLADIALLPESQWLVSLGGFRDDVQFRYPAQTILLDFPLVYWPTVEPDPDVPAAVDLFADWLLREQTQRTLPAYGLRPATTEPTSEAQLFAAAEPFGIQYQPDFTQPVQPPGRSAVLSLLTWYNQIR